MKETKKPTSESIRIRKAEYELLDTIMKKANNKNIGKKIIPSDLFAIVLNNVSDNQIKQLQLSSVRHTAYSNANGDLIPIQKVSLFQFKR